MGPLRAPPVAVATSGGPGDVLIRDNLCALHKATFDFDPNSRRHLPRLVLRGERLVLET